MTDSGFDKHRIAALQDGVYSIAMTLLVLELKLPSLPEHLGGAELWTALHSIWPKLLTWMLSFWVLSVFWIGDARANASLLVVDKVLLRLALCKLAAVSLVPFSTALVGEHGNLVPGSAVYAAHIATISLLQTSKFVYLERHPNLVSSTDHGAAATTRFQSLALLVCSLLALAIAFILPGYNMLAPLPVPFLQRAFKARQRKGIVTS